MSAEQTLRLKHRVPLLSRYRFLVLLTFILAGLYIILRTVYYDISVFDMRASSLLQRRHRDRKVKGIINTEGCTIPNISPITPYIKSYVKYPSDLPQCHNSSQALLGRNRTSIWIRRETFNFYNISDADEVTCCYRSFYRPKLIKDITSKHIDNRVKYNNCTIFNDTVLAKDEFVRVNCSVNSEPLYEQFYIIVPKKKFFQHGDNHEIINKFGYNVLIVGIDTVSRLNLLRTMPKTASYLNMKGAVDMLGYNIVSRNTFSNLVPMFLGVDVDEITRLCYPNNRATFDNCPFIWEWYKQAGYYTAYAEDAISDSTFNKGKVGFARQPTDYYFRTFYSEAEKHVAYADNLCMNDVYFYKVLLNYMEEMTWRLQSKRLFGLFWETSMSHDYLNYPMIMDEDYLKMFINLEASGYLDETIVFFVSDHGIRWGPIRSTKQGHLEQRLPFLYILTPLSFQENYKKAFDNLKLNRGRLTTPFDVFETLSDLIDLNNIKDSAITARREKSYALKRGISLFLPVPSNRTCQTAGIGDQWCTCLDEVPIAKKHPFVAEAAKTLVKMINFRLEDYANCAYLVLASIVDAHEIQIGERNEAKNPWREFIVVVNTIPNDAIYEGVLRYHTKDKSWQLTNAPIRLNLYKTQSWCMEDYKLTEFCYCI